MVFQNTSSYIILFNLHTDLAIQSEQIITVPADTREEMLCSPRSDRRGVGRSQLMSQSHDGNPGLSFSFCWSTLPFLCLLTPSRGPSHRQLGQ